MTSFLVLVAIMTAVAVAFIAIPLWGPNRSLGPTGENQLSNNANLEILRNQRRELELERDCGVLSSEQYQSAIREIEHRLLTEIVPAVSNTSDPRRQSAWIFPAIAVVIPLVAGTLYWHLGTPRAITTKSEADQSAPSAAQIEAGMVEAQRRVKADGKDTQAWLMLARGNVIAGKLDDAVAAYEKVLQLAPKQPEPILELAELLARNTGTLAGRPTQLIEQALAVSPHYWKALALSGRAAFDRGDYEVALEHWEALKAIVPKDSAALPAIEQGIGEARARLATHAIQSSSNNSQAVPASVSGTVTLEETLHARAQADDTVFVFARLPSGPPMPLAVMRKQVRDLPFDFTLDDSMSMSPEMRISTAKELVVEARISKSGDAMPKSGDLQGKSAVAVPGSNSLQVRIDSVVP